MTNKTLVLNPACLKTLSAVEAKPERSNQHEFNGVRQLKRIFGHDKFKTSAEFSVRGKEIHDRANVTWYDAREDNPSRTEHIVFQINNFLLKPIKIIQRSQNPRAFFS